MYNETDFSEYIPNDNSLKWYQLEPNDAKELVIKLVLFVICPFAAFLGSLLRPTSKSSFVIYFLFGILFCWHMDPAGLTEYDDYMGIRDEFLAYKYSMADFLEKFVGYITLQGKERDLYSVFLNAFTRIFSSNFHLYFAIASIPYLIFSLASVRKLTESEEFPRCGIYALLIILLFVIPRDIVTVQNPRYTTAVWISMWGFLNYFDRSKSNWKWYTIPIILSVVLHTGLLPMVLVFLMAIIVPLPVKKIELIFFVSIPFSFFSYELFANINYSFLPSFLSHWIQSYLSDDMYAKLILNKGRSGFFWVTQLFSYISYVAYFLIPIMMMKYKEQILENSEIGKLYPFYILLFSITNFIRMLPTIGVRYFLTIQIMSVYMFFKVFYPMKKNYFWVLLFAWSFPIFLRWFYSGAGLHLVPKNIYFDNLFSLINDYLL